MMIPHLKNIPYEEQLAKLKLWSLEDRRVHADLTEVFTTRRNARIASAVLATAIPSVCLSHAGIVIFQKSKNPIF